MTCCCSAISDATNRQFGDRRASEDLRQYRAKGPGATTRLLVVGLAKADRLQGHLLDVGSGVGALTFELLERGMTAAVGVDLSSAYVAAAAVEAARTGRSDAVRFLRADFVDVAGELAPADVVTLDRVVCCYPGHERLLDESLKHAKRCLALSYPRDLWYVRFWVGLQNFARTVRRRPFRTFVHRATAMENRIHGAGFRLMNRSTTRTWSADVYVRS